MAFYSGRNCAMGHATQTGSISASCRNPAQEMQRTGARERNCASKQVKPHTFDQACALPTASSPFNPTWPAPTTIIPASCRNPASRHSRCSGQARASRLARTGYRVQAARSEGSLHLQAALVRINRRAAPDAGAPPPRHGGVGITSQPKPAVSQSFPNSYQWSIWSTTKASLSI